MIKKTINFTDVDGNPLTEDFYFALNRAEIVEMELTAGTDENGEPQTFTDMLRRIAEGGDAQKIVDTFKSIIDKSYGVRSADGRRFIKSPELLEEFKQTDAYSELFVELATEADAAAQFVNGLVPANLGSGPLEKSPSQLARERSEAALQGHKPKQPAEVPSVTQLPDLENETQPKKLTDAEIDALNVPDQVKEQIRASQQ